ncbi:PspC domain-containing protein [Actinokineospora cianjurensis]|uniref:Phage shock protein C (PspC) family protein n=1 Tax=Actinokineospora cianjurensis TaxID=585224 RepID=A0A421B666_9PSEU|nr:PspC domain-containing protein [Actinokineospora cianjurensis]RLK59733.1 phage shock protein C (PspC) family protein [Actinokineospora cianjurensis]
MTNETHTKVQGHVRKFRRSRSDRMVAGVCGGIARAMGVDAPIVRIGLVAATLLGFGTGAVIYLACWILLPEDD